ncbi:MAG: hypothetical protein RL215_831, partial [Planctomycetota bacterium]
MGEEISRRTAIGSLACGSLLFPGIVSELLSADGGEASAGGLSARAPHGVPRASRVIFLFMSGGVSHVDS